MEFESKIMNKLDSIQSDLTTLKIDNAKQTLNVARNTKDLSEHIEGVVQNRKRIELLEVSDAKSGMVYKILIGIGSSAGAAFAVIRLLN